MATMCTIITAKRARRSGRLHRSFYRRNRHRHTHSGNCTEAAPEGKIQTLPTTTWTKACSAALSAVLVYEPVMRGLRSLPPPSQLLRQILHPSLRLFRQAFRSRGRRQPSTSRIRKKDNAPLSGPSSSHSQPQQPQLRVRRPPRACPLRQWAFLHPVVVALLP